MTPIEAVRHLAEMDLKQVSVFDIRRMFEIIEDLPAITATIQADTIISRVRMGYHLQKNELKYPPVSLCRKIQRASLPGESAFYACLSDSQQHLEHERAIGLSECSTLAREGILSVGREHMTISQWHIKKPLHVISFVTDKTFATVEQRSKHICILSDAFNETYHTLTDVQKEVIRIIDEDFCKVAKEDYEYKRTAILAHDMLYDSQYDLDAIVYAPVHMEGRFGINVMIKPTSVDDKLELYRVLHCSYYKNKDQGLMLIDKGYDKNGHLIARMPTDENEVCQRIGIHSIRELPIIHYN